MSRGKELQNALRSIRDMDEYLETHSAQMIIDDIKAVSATDILRDQFAMAAVTSLGHGFQTPMAALRAYEIADQMLIARQAEKKGK